MKNRLFQQQNNYYPRGNVPRHSAVLEEIHEEEQDSIPEEDETNLEKPSHSENGKIAAQFILNI